MKISIAQINPILGDFEYNLNLIKMNIKKAQQESTDLLVFPECSLFGYHPMDLLGRKSIVREQINYIYKIEKIIPSNLCVIIGAITMNNNKCGKKYFNSAIVLRSRKPSKLFHKELLPAYDVFDEARHIEPGDLSKNIIKINDKKALITICEDIWGWTDSAGESYYSKNPLKKIKPKQVDLIINLSGSPFTLKKEKQRLRVTQETVKYFKAPMVYANLVGAQDEMIFDGSSLFLDKNGKIIHKLNQFKEDFQSVVLTTEMKAVSKKVPSKKNNIEKLRGALCLGIQDFATKTNLKSVHLGLSGGVDSALVAALAVDALGPEAVTALALPSKFNSSQSLKFAKAQSKNMNIKLHQLDINHIYHSIIKEIESQFGNIPFGLMHENAQARVRGSLLMAYSNLNHSLLLNTSNKSELTVGYSTLYGDLCGGLCPIGDLTKNLVYKMAQIYQEKYSWIPNGVITRPPSAELRPNQKDTDSLPSYDKLDPLVLSLIENKTTKKTTENTRILKMMMMSEFKRWQAPPILKVSSHAFGRGRRFPIAHRAIY